MLGSLQMSSTMPGRRERKPSFSSTRGAAAMLAARPPRWRGVEQRGLAGVEDIVLIKNDLTKRAGQAVKQQFQFLRHTFCFCLSDLF